MKQDDKKQDRENPRPPSDPKPAPPVDPLGDIDNPGKTPPPPPPPPGGGD